MNIAFDQHIINLLKEHECVVLPGIGGLLLKKVAAHSSNGQIYPASKIIRFNSNITQDADLLVASLVNELSLPYLEAKQEVQNFVGRIKFKLTQNGFCDIESLGRFSLTEDDHIKFIANANIKNLDKSNYGFTSLHAFPIHRVIIEDKPAVETKVVELVPETHQVRKIRKSALVGLVATLVFMLGIFSLIVSNTTVDSFKVQDANVLNFLVPSNSNTEKHEGNIRYQEKRKNGKSKKNKKTSDENINDIIIEEVGEIPSEVEALSNNVNNNRKQLENLNLDAENAEIKADVVDNNLIEDVLRVSDDNNPTGYYVVTGAFSSMSNANKAKYNCSLENTCEVFKTANGMYRVAIFASDNTEEALNIITEFKKENSSFWLMENY